MRTILGLFCVAALASAQYTPPGGTATTPASPANSIQYNNAGAFGGMAGTAWTDATRDLEIDAVSTDPMLIFSANPIGDPNYSSLLYLNPNSLMPTTVSGAAGVLGAFIGFRTVGGGHTTIATTGVGGNSGDLLLRTGGGGSAYLATTASTGGNSQAINLVVGSGGSAQVAGTGINTGGSSDGIILTCGSGGDASDGATNIGGGGGTCLVRNGSGGTGSTANGLDGTFVIRAGARANAPIAQFKLSGGTVVHTIAADGIPQYSSIAEPTCDSTTRGKTTMVQGGAGVADTFRICTKDAADAYGWRALF